MRLIACSLLKNGGAIAGGCYATAIFLAVAANLTQPTLPIRQIYINAMVFAGTGGTVLAVASLIYLVDRRGNN